MQRGIKKKMSRTQLEYVKEKGMKKKLKTSKKFHTQSTHLGNHQVNAYQLPHGERIETKQPPPFLLSVFFLLFFSLFMECVCGSSVIGRRNKEGLVYCVVGTVEWLWLGL